MFEIHRHAGHEGFRIELYGTHTSHHDARALDGRARLEAADVVEFRRDGVGLVSKRETAEIGALQRHEEQGGKTENDENTDPKLEGFLSLHGGWSPSERPFGVLRRIKKKFRML